MMKKNWIILLVLFVGILNAQWSSDPFENNAICDLTGEQAIPKVVNGPTGDTYIGFFSNDSGNYDVRLQRLDSLGNELWTNDGILISDNPAMTWLTDWDMTVDADNHAILTFQDIRNAGDNNIYAYRIAPDGTFVWGADGLELSNSAAFDVSPKAEVTSEGNVIIAWQSDDDSIMQKITPDGTLLWGASGITISTANTISWPQPFAVDNDEIILKYFEDTGSFPGITRYCYAQKYDTDGNAVWANSTVVSNAGGISAWTQIFNIISDENNGCFITWHDTRGGGMTSYPFTQHILADGTVEFTANGVQLSTENNRQSYCPESVYFGATDELITYWKQTDGNQNNHGITGQKLDADGNILWGNNGNNLIAISSNYIRLVGLRKAEDDLMLILEDYINYVDVYVTAAKLDQDGSYVWPDQQVIMCSVASGKVHNVVSQLSNGQFIASWEDDRNGTTDIYAQNINLDGTIGQGAAPNGTIEGTVVLIGGVGDVTEVEISIGTIIANPDVNGDFSISLPAGTYALEVSLEYYTPVNLPDIVVSSGTATIINDDILLNWIPVYNPPQNGSVNSNTGLVSWDPPEPYPGAVLIGYNIYLDGVFLAFVTETSYQLENLVNGMQYTVGITAVYEGGFESDFVTLDFLYSGTGAGNNLITATELIGNYPNPFNPNTNISYSIKEAGLVKIDVYNSKGQFVRTLVSESKETGNYTVNWNGTDETNKSVTSGVYFYKMKAGKFVSTKKMILMK
jgi:FlgD Ig-like domain/Fibronectin type III domain